MAATSVPLPPLVELPEAPAEAAALPEVPTLTLLPPLHPAMSKATAAGAAIPLAIHRVFMQQIPSERWARPMRTPAVSAPLLAREPSLG
jgi:hypothetical protein